YEVTRYNASSSETYKISGISSSQTGKMGDTDDVVVVGLSDLEWRSGGMYIKGLQQLFETDPFVQVNEAYILAPQSLQQNSNAPQKQPPIQPASGPARTKKVALNASTDKLYSQLRDLNFAMVASVISQTARKIQEDISSLKKFRFFLGSAAWPE
ncbi:hypothetical protein HDU80_005223, partial [Chytriomyces hyalinus]